MSTVTAEHNHHHEHHFDGSKMFWFLDIYYE